MNTINMKKPIIFIQRKNKLYLHFKTYNKKMTLRTVLILLKYCWHFVRKNSSTEKI